jgi:hypothetical protein
MLTTKLFKALLIASAFISATAMADVSVGLNVHYPPRGHYVRTLPPGYHDVWHGGTRYYYGGGAWYRPSGARFVVVAPPIGLFAPVLPPYYSTVWIHGTRYYYADDVYYAYDPEQSGYVVIEKPGDAPAASSTPPSAPDDLFIYPKNGQNENQQSTDRYECHKWASDQTGFDPSAASGGVAASQREQKRTEYRRAMTACLEARGYSVK